MHIDSIRHIQKAIAMAGLSAVLSAGGWAQTEVKPPSSTRPQSPPQSQSSPAGSTRKDAPTTQEAAGGGAGMQTTGAAQTNAVPQSGAPVRFLGPPVTIYDQVQQAAQAADDDLGRLRIDKWKADSGSKQQAQEMTRSVGRNLQAALPEILQAARAGQGNLGAQFKLYHNLTALYETLSTLTEAAGTFGPKQDYEPLARDVSALEQSRRTLADYIQNLAAQNGAELTKLRAAAQQQAQAAQQQQKKVIVDEQQPKKKSTTKKKSSSAAKPQ